MLKKVIAIILLVFIGLGVLAYFATKRIEEAKNESEEIFKRNEEYNKTINSVANRNGVDMITGKKYMTFDEAAEVSGSKDVNVIMKTMKEYNDKIDKGE